MAFRLNREVEDLFITKILEKRELHHLDREFMLGKISLYCEKNQKACRKFAETPLTRIKKAKFADLKRREKERIFRLPQRKNNNKKDKRRAV